MDTNDKAIDFTVKVHFAIDGEDYNLETSNQMGERLLTSIGGIEHLSQHVFYTSTQALKQKLFELQGIDDSPQAMYERRLKEVEEHNRQHSIPK